MTLLDQLPTTSPGPVFKTLSLLKDLDDVLELGFSEDNNRYDAKEPAPHPWLYWPLTRWAAKHYYS